MILRAAGGARGGGWCRSAAIGDSDARLWIRRHRPHRMSSLAPAVGFFISSLPHQVGSLALAVGLFISNLPHQVGSLALAVGFFFSNLPHQAGSWALAVGLSDFRPKPILFKGISCKQAARKPEQHTPAFLHYFAYSISFISLLELLFIHFPFGTSLHSFPFWIVFPFIALFGFILFQRIIHNLFI